LIAATFSIAAAEGNKEKDNHTIIQKIVDLMLLKAMMSTTTCRDTPCPTS